MAIRIFMGTVGSISMMSGLILIVLSIWRLSHPIPEPLPISKLLAAIVGFAFFLSSFLAGMCWIMVALSGRLWKSTF